MTTTVLTPLKCFGDAHHRYALRDGTIVDVILEGAGLWCAYLYRGSERVGQEVESASSEAELLQKLERQFQ
jgi:hypothetical protein